MICEEELKKFFARETLSFEKFNFQIFTGNEEQREGRNSVPNLELEFSRNDNKTLTIFPSKTKEK